jgi:hypothetical protein
LTTGPSRLGRPLSLGPGLEGGRAYGRRAVLGAERARGRGLGLWRVGAFTAGNQARGRGVGWFPLRYASESSPPSEVPPACRPLSSLSG